MQPDLVVSALAVASLVPYAENARTHSPSQVAQIAASIAEFGFVNPVLVDAEGVLKGLVRHHDALKVLNDRIATISAGDSGIHSYSKASAFLLVKKRLFWLLVLAALNFGVAAVVATFEETISQNLVLAGFIPLLAGMGGNIGAQASGLVIAGTSSRDISPKDIFRVLWKEM